jgi:O-antigen ligase
LSQFQQGQSFGAATAFRPPQARLGSPLPGVIQPAASGNSFSLILLGCYALMLTVPIAELLVTYVGLHVPVVVIVNLALTLVLFTTGRMFEFWTLPIAKPYMAVLVLFTIAAVLGIYPGQSVPFIFQYDLRFHLLPFYCCAIVQTTRQLRQVYSWIGWGAFLLLFLCFQFGVMLEDRLAIPETSLSNPNDLGFAILFVMSGLLVLRSKFSRILVALALPLFFAYILKTGSRADLITLVMIAFIAFFLATRKWKLIMLATVPLVAAGLLSVVPAQTLARLTTIVTDPTSVQTEDKQLQGALGSQAARTQLQRRALEACLRHPLLGVGVGLFQVAVDEMVQETLHVKSGWQEAHNTYLQVAAENGIPALIFYLWTLVLCLKMNYAAYKVCRQTPSLHHAIAQSFALTLMTLMYMICTAFSNNSCDPHYCVLIGLSAANYLAVRRELPSPEPDQEGRSGLAQPQRNRAAWQRLDVPAIRHPFRPTLAA